MHKPLLTYSVHIPCLGDLFCLRGSPSCPIPFGLFCFLRLFSLHILWLRVHIPPVIYSAHLPFFSDLFCTKWTFWCLILYTELVMFDLFCISNQSSWTFFLLLFLSWPICLLTSPGRVYVYKNDIFWICVHVHLVTYLLHMPHLGDLFSTFWRLILYT